MVLHTIESWKGEDGAKSLDVDRDGSGNGKDELDFFSHRKDSWRGIE